MRYLSAFILAAAACAFASAQSFECAPIGPLPANPALNCESVSSDGQVLATGVTATASCGFPTAGGSQYLTISSHGGGFPNAIAVPFGGPFQRPVAALASEVRIPIPTGASVISFDWEFFNGETQNSTYNDGVSIDVVDPNGLLVGNILYADTATLLQPLGCNGTFGVEVAPAGPQNLVAVLPVYAPCDYISIAVWNGTDNAVISKIYIDNVVFNTTALGCIPCSIATVPVLSHSAPFGAGSVLISMSSLTANGTYFYAVTFLAGNFPNGWLYGVDIPPVDLAALINFGPPFFGPLDGCGSGAIGPFGGLPSGLSIYALAFGIPAGSVNPTVHTAATSFTIP